MTRALDGLRRSLINRWMRRLAHDNIAIRPSKNSLRLVFPSYLPTRAFWYDLTSTGRTGRRACASMLRTKLDHDDRITHLNELTFGKRPNGVIDNLRKLLKRRLIQADASKDPEINFGLRDIMDDFRYGGR